MLQFVLTLIPLLLGIFWLWMFADMSKEGDLPSYIVTISNGANPRLDWTLGFVIFNVLTAIYYYFTVYRYKHN